MCVNHETITSVEQQFNIYQVPTSSSCVTSPFELEGVKMQEEISGLRYLLVKSRFRTPPKDGNSTYTAVSAHSSKTPAKRRDVAMQVLGKLRKVAENTCADISAGVFNSSAYRERGKAWVSSIEETWEKMFLIAPSDLVPVGARWRNQETAAVSQYERGVNKAGELQGIEAFNSTKTRCK